MLDFTSNLRVSRIPCRLHEDKTHLPEYHISHYGHHHLALRGEASNISQHSSPCKKAKQDQEQEEETKHQQADNVQK